jgi:hypothetical protein
MRNNDETIPEEICKDIPNLPDYEASTWGNINSLDRQISGLLTIASI